MLWHLFLVATTYASYYSLPLLDVAMTLLAVFQTHVTEHSNCITCKRMKRLVEDQTEGRHVKIFLSSTPSGPLSITKAQEKLSRCRSDIIKVSLQQPVSSLVFLLFFIISMTINDFYYSDSRAQPLSSFPRQEITQSPGRIHIWF